MAGVMTFWDTLLEKCAGKGAYYQLQCRLIEADLRDIETPSNPDRPSTRFLPGGEDSPVSSNSPTLSDATSAGGAWGAQFFDVPHARVRKTLDERHGRSPRIREPPADVCRTSYSSLTAAAIVASPFDPSHRKDSQQSIKCTCPRNAYDGLKPFFLPAGQENSKYADCAPGKIGEEARAKKRAARAKEGIDLLLFKQLKEWLRKEHPNFKLPDKLPEDPNALKEQASEEAFLRKRSNNPVKPPMREYIDEDGTSVQVGFDSLPNDPLRPLTRQEIEDMRKLSSCVRRVSVEGLDSLEPIDATQSFPMPPSTVPSHMKRQQARRQLRHSGYPHNQRVTNAKRSQSSHAIMSRKTSRGPQVPASRRPVPERRITIVETREEAENAIESDEEDQPVEVKHTSKAKMAKPAEAVEDDGNGEYSDIVEEDEEDINPSKSNNLTVARLMSGDFTPEGRAFHDMERQREQRRHKPRKSQRTVLEPQPEVVSNNEVAPITIPYKPSKIINENGLVVTFKP
ncbi:hypothetical protein EV356DRAFT_514997 [Viridothelium virens]|uniref:Uncharacterized protein n=1 Tax=Viridothelium virens TaxID=1048519 RepID=A0A6A6H9T7_VIRVR|nr:hypothetical protein EV356DRAFT_514997 [Viridothelium virens]